MVGWPPNLASAGQPGGGHAEALPRLPEEDLLVIGDDKEVSTSMLPAITEGRATIMPSPQQPVLDFAEG